MNASGPPESAWPPPSTPSESTSGWGRWQQRARWQRWSAYVLAGTVGLAGLGAVAGESDPDSSEPTETLPPVMAAAPSTEAITTTTTAPATTTTLPPTTTSTTSTSTTTTTLPPTTTVPGSLLALDVLATIPVENERPDGYDRDFFAYGDIVDVYGCSTRARVLIRDSLTPAQVDPVGCAVVAGDWLSVYDAVTWPDPAELEIDHAVALKEAWDSGAWGWVPERRSAFGNDLEDPRTLRAVTGSVNQSKSDKDPSNWIPPNAEFVCTYLSDWVSIKARWGLSMDQSEFGRIRNLLTDRCPDQAIAPWPDTPPSGPPVTQPPVEVATPPPPPTGNCDSSYPDVCIPPSPPDLDCGDITFRRFTVLPPDPHRFDGSDNDGVGCESG